MSEQFWLTKAQLKRIKPFFPADAWHSARGRPACGQRDSPCDPEWSAMAGCARGLWPPQDALQPVRSLVPHGHLRQPCGRERPARPRDDRQHASQGASDGRQSAQKGDSPRLIGRTKGGLNSKLHAVCDGAGRPVIFLLTQGQMSDHKGAALIYPMLPDAETLIADKGYDSDAFREALAGRGITPCIPPRAKRRLPATYCKTLYRQRHKVENMFTKLKDWRRISMRYDRCDILQRYLHRGNRYLLARTMSPEPR
jgi:transposase